jgi:hypothetical protein
MAPFETGGFNILLEMVFLHGVCSMFAPFTMIPCTVRITDQSPDGRLLHVVTTGSQFFTYTMSTERKINIHLVTSEASFSCPFD